MTTCDSQNSFAVTFTGKCRVEVIFSRVSCVDLNTDFKVYSTSLHLKKLTSTFRCEVEVDEDHVCKKTHVFMFIYS